MQKRLDNILVEGRRGVVHYRSHAEADADMREMISARMARKAQELARKPS